MSLQVMLEKTTELFSVESNSGTLYSWLVLEGRLELVSTHLMAQYSVFQSFIQSWTKLLIFLNYNLLKTLLQA